MTKERIVAAACGRIIDANKNQVIDLQKMQELGECAYYNDESLREVFQSHRAAGHGIRQHYENIRRIHPFVDEEHLRYSANDIIKMVQNPSRVCSCGETHDLSVKTDQSSYPKFTGSSSTADIITCTKCGRRWEEAYTIVYSCCVLKPSINEDETIRQ